MKLRNKRRAFTIVELVIVVAVIGVLAAVLIPTFVNLTNKAKLSNDQMMVKNMNTTLAIKKASEGDIKYAGDAITALYADGWNIGKLQPFSSGYRYGYHLQSNTMYLLNRENKIVFPQNDTLSYQSLWFTWQNQAIDKVNGADKYIALVNVTESSTYYNSHFNNSAEYTLDLAGHFINVNTSLTNVTAINGIIINGATGGEETTELDQGTKDDIAPGTSETVRTVIENKVFNFSTDLRSKVENTSNVTYKNCFFYSWKGEGAGIMNSNVIFDSCTFIDATSYIFSVQGDSDKAYEGNLEVRNCTFTNCARVFNIPVFVKGETSPGSIKIIGNTFNAVTGDKRGFIQLCEQQNYSSQEGRGYINIEIKDNNFVEIATTQAGIIILHENLIREDGETSADYISFSDNQVGKEIDSNKYIVNDDGKTNSQFNPYNIAAFKTNLTSKFVAGIKK